MPLIKITQEDLNRMNQPDPGWHLCAIRQIKEAISKKKDSTNYTIECEVIDSAVSKANIGRYCYPLFNSKAMGRIVPFIAAANGISTVEPGEMELDSLIGKQLWIEVVEAVNSENGQLVKRAENFAAAEEVPF